MSRGVQGGGLFYIPQAWNNLATSFAGLEVLRVSECVFLCFFSPGGRTLIYPLTCVIKTSDRPLRVEGLLSQASNSQTRMSDGDQSRISKAAARVSTAVPAVLGVGGLRNFTSVHL